MNSARRRIGGGWQWLTHKSFIERLLLFRSGKSSKLQLSCPTLHSINFIVDSESKFRTHRISKAFVDPFLWPILIVEFANTICSDCRFSSESFVRTACTSSLWQVQIKTITRLHQIGSFSRSWESQQSIGSALRSERLSARWKWLREIWS